MGDERSDAGTADLIAIIGMACRFPGAVNSPADFWDLLRTGGDAIRTVPTGRWDAYAGVSAEHAAALRTVTSVGGFRTDIDEFDAGFFGLSPREAALMDPQQRVVLELAWEALEHAGVVPGSLVGSDAGVFVGVNSDDHGRRLLEDLPRIEARSGIGSSLCAVANRVSHALDLRGPSMSVDTACSASLVAVHLACQSLRLRESSLALAGGVMLMVGPGLTAVMDAAGALSRSGRSRSFDAAADGYGRGEGAGLVVLKRLADAWRDGDRVLAVVRGSAVAQDGATEGIMAPNRAAQVHLLRTACLRAGVHPHAVDYVEAHGTGTRAGDPAEAGALADVFGAGRPAARPCLVGSVKSNIGHLEAASGVAGLIKAVLALGHGVIPATLHFSQPNPQIAWDSAGLRVVDGATRWPSTGRARLAGVSSHGYGGTLAHLIVEQASQPTRPVAPADDVPRIFPLSGASDAAVCAGATRLANWLAGHGGRVPLADVAHTLAHRRSHLGWRTAVVASSRGELAARLRNVRGTAATAAGAVWVFSGHGSQWPGMGRELARTDAAFRRTLDRIAPVFREECGRTPTELLAAAGLDTPDAQLAIFAVQLALAATWSRLGVRPVALIGHSVGEITAAVVAGAMDEEQGARLVCRRSALLRRVAGTGAMAMVNASWSDVVDLLGSVPGVTPAIHAATQSTVVAGQADQVDELVRRWRSQSELIVHRVAADIAFHSPQMDPLLDDLAQALAELRPRVPRIPLYSTVSDDPRDMIARDARYWVANLRRPVRLRQAVEAALDDGHRVFLEISPHPVVAHSVAETAAGCRVTDVTVVHTLRRHRPEHPTLLANLADLHTAGVSVDWSVVQADGVLAELPATAWQHREYRIEPARRQVHQPRHDPARHDLLGAATTVGGAPQFRLWQTFLDRSNRPYPGHHPVLGTEIVPAAVLLTTFRRAAGSAALVDVALSAPVPVDDTGRQLQVVRTDGLLRLSSRPPGADGSVESGDSWLLHSSAVIDQSARRTDRDRVGIGECHARCAGQLDPRYVVDRLVGVGVAAMGFPWRVEELRHGPGELLARVSTDPDGAASGATANASALDAALSIAAALIPDSGALRMPAHLGRLAVVRDSPAEVFVSVRLPDPDRPDTVDVDILSANGDVVARLTELRFAPLPDGAGSPAGPARLVHAVRWTTCPRPRTARRIDRVVLVRGEPAPASALEAALGDLGVHTTTVADPDEMDRLGGLLDGSSAVVVEPGSSPRDSRSAGVAGFRASWLLLRTARVLAAKQSPDGPRLWCLTRGVREARTNNSLGDSSLWGVGRVLAGEHPELWGGVVDVDALGSVDAGALLDTLRSAPLEDVVSLRADGAAVPRLVPLGKVRSADRVTCRPESTYLITGGLGVLGRQVAHWLADRGARRLVLVGRNGLVSRELWDEVTDPRTRERIETVRRLESAGITVRTLAMDITDRVLAAKLLCTAELGLPPIRGIVHAAGVLDNRLAVDLDIRSLVRVMRPKVAGALVLHEMFPPGSVDFFALFSSAGPLLGLPGQASYGAANAFLDALAVHRRAAGCTGTTSFSWTSWRGLGMSTSSRVTDVELAARGVGDITMAEAFECWDHGAVGSTGHVTVLRTVPLHAGGRRPQLLSELAEPSGAGSADAAVPPAGGEPWVGMSGEQRRAYLFSAVASVITAELGRAEGELDPHRPLAEIGVDSVLSQVIRRMLERRFLVTLPATVFWSSPTISAIVEHLADHLADQLGQHGKGAAHEA